MPPASRSRVLGALRRVSPSFPDVSTEDTSVGAELGAIATTIGEAVDVMDAIPNEIFPNTAETTLSRWEKSTGIATRPSDDLDVRRARVLAVLRRTSGPRVAQLRSILAGPLDIDGEDLEFLESLRSSIEAGVTDTISDDLSITSSARLIDIGKPWPGLVDDVGVRLYLDLSALGTPTVSVIHADGTSWTPTISQATGWVYTRTHFLGRRAAGPWRVSVANGSNVTLRETRLLVSNDVDSAQIFQFYVYADPALSGTPDIAEARRLFGRIALGHMQSAVIQRRGFMVGDPNSIVGQNPVGA